MRFTGEVNMSNEAVYTQEQYIDHEVRLRLNEARYKHLEKSIEDVKKLLYWVLGTVIVGVLIPGFIHSLFS